MNDNIQIVRNEECFVAPVNIKTSFNKSFLTNCKYKGKYILTDDDKKNRILISRFRFQ